MVTNFRAVERSSDFKTYLPTTDFLGKADMDERGQIRMKKDGGSRKMPRVSGGRRRRLVKNWGGQKRTEDFGEGRMRPESSGGGGRKMEEAGIPTWDDSEG